VIDWGTAGWIWNHIFLMVRSLPSCTWGFGCRPGLLHEL